MNKPKRLFLLLLVSMVALAAQSQVRLGLFGGPHSSSVLEQNSIPGWDTTTKRHYSNASGVHIGVLADVPLGKNFYLQPGIGYISKGNKYAINNDSAHSVSSDTVFYTKTLSINYIEVPIYLTYKFPLSASHKSSFFISAGPYFGFYYDGNTSVQSKIYSTSTYTNRTTNLSVGKGVQQYKTSDMGVNARAGFELGSFVLNGYFSRGLTSFYTASYSGTFQHQVVGGSIGFWLSKTEARAVKPKDTDKDGIPDNQDLCPTKPGVAKYNGCPVPDTDHDGIPDDKDSCKNVSGVAKYHGCPIPDTDGDGVNDEQDSCKTVPGVAKYHGCPIPDRDHDGVNDEEDKCPDVAGSPANHGCPLDTIKQETREIVQHTAKKILFLSGKTELSPTSFKSLDELAALLAKHPSWKVTIEGHTDNVHVAMGNQALSQKRAEIIKAYLVKKGIEASRLSAIGYGDTKPVADNSTAEGKAMNRRVEIVLTEQ